MSKDWPNYPAPESTSSQHQRRNIRWKSRMWVRTFHRRSKSHSQWFSKRVPCRLAPISSYHKGKKEFLTTRYERCRNTRSYLRFTFGRFDRRMRRCSCFWNCRGRHLCGALLASRFLSISLFGCRIVHNGRRRRCGRKYLLRRWNRPRSRQNDQRGFGSCLPFSRELRKFRRNGSKCLSTYCHV